MKYYFMYTVYNIDTIVSDKIFITKNYLFVLLIKKTDLNSAVWLIEKFTTEYFVAIKGSGFCSTASNGLHPHPHNCSLYYNCWDGIGDPLPCPAGQYFSTKYNGCDYASNVECTNQPTNAPVTEGPVTNAPTQTPAPTTRAPTQAPETQAPAGKNTIRHTYTEIRKPVGTR